MSNFIKNTKYEFRYLNQSKIILFFLIFVIALVAILSFLDFQFVSDAYDDYQRQERFYQENGANIEEEISKGYNLVEDSNNVGVENPISYFYQLTNQALYATSPEYAASHILEFGMIVFPLVFGILGVALATNDYKDKLYRHRALRFGRQSFFFTKLVSMLSLIIGVLIVSVFLSKLTDMLLYNNICSSIPVEKFNAGMVEQKSGILTKLAVSLLENFTYASLGFMLGTIFKNQLLSGGIFALYMIIPFIGKYDIRNCVTRLSCEYFDFYGIAHLESNDEAEMWITLLIIFGTIIVTNAVSFILIRKRSAFN